MVDHLGRVLGSWLLPVNVSTAILLVAALVVDRAIARHARASVRIALYAPVALRVFLPPSWWIPVARAPRLAALAPAADFLTAAPAGSQGAALTPYVGVAVVYFAVALVLAARAVVRRARLGRALAAAQVETSIDAPCAIVRHAELGPMVVGVLSPRIVLPAILLDEIGGSSLSCVLRHEIAHVTRRDPWLSAALEALAIVAWPVVPLRVAVSRVRHLMELACDEAALAGASAIERRQYGHALLDFAERGSMVIAGELHFGATLRARIEALALQRPWPRALQLGLVATSVLAFAACSSVGPTGQPPAAAASTPSTPETEEREAGHLAPEVIQANVRASFGTFRACYERGLANSPKLEGTVTVAFTIDEDGTVHDARADDASTAESRNPTTLPDKSVVDCVVHGFDQLTFPKPQGGVVTVIYPIVFNP